MTRETFPSYTVLVSNAVDGDIGAFTLDTATGRIKPDCRYAAAETVMPMAVSADRGLLFSATRGVGRSIVCYRIDALTGQLSRTRATGIASSLAYLCAEPSGRYLMGASYGEHRLSVYSASGIAEGDGRPVQVVDDIRNAHAVIVSADQRFAYASSLGSDRIFCFAISEQANDAPLTLVETVTPGEGFGPRHLRFSSDENLLYVLSEFQATVAVFNRDRVTGRLESPRISSRPLAVADLLDGRARETLSPTTMQSHVWAADIHITPDDRFVYVSERTLSRLIRYGVQADGSLEYSGFTVTETQPRGFQIDPSGRFLVACGEKSTHVAAYAINAETGALTLSSRCNGGQGANWIEFIYRSESISSVSADSL